MDASTSQLECFCGRYFSNPVDFEEHREARGHFASHKCSPWCNHEKSSKYDYTIQVCGCGKVSERPDIAADHFILTGHCFCSDCDQTFHSLSALALHLETQSHTTEWRCWDCDRLFVNYQSLKMHIIKGSVHQKPYVRKQARKRNHVKLDTVRILRDHMCEVCERMFVSRKTLRMHRIQSRVHQPSCEGTLSRVASHEKVASRTMSKAWKCADCQRTFSFYNTLQRHLASNTHEPLTLRYRTRFVCQKKFASLAGLVDHLESGACRYRRGANNIIQMVELYDKERRFHNTLALAPSTSVRGPYPRIAPLTTPFETLVEQLALSPATVSTSNLKSDKTNVSSPQEDAVSTVPVARFACPLCPPEHIHTFPDTERHRAHLNSPKHTSLQLHCPSTTITTTEEDNKKQSTELGSLTEYVEQHANATDQTTFCEYVDFVSQQLERLNLSMDDESYCCQMERREEME